MYVCAYTHPYAVDTHTCMSRNTFEVQEIVKARVRLYGAQSPIHTKPSLKDMFKNPRFENQLEAQAKMDIKITSWPYVMLVALTQDGQKANVIRCQKLHLRRGAKNSDSKAYRRG